MRCLGAGPRVRDLQTTQADDTPIKNDDRRPLELRARPLRPALPKQPYARRCAKPRGGVLRTYDKLPENAPLRAAQNPGGRISSSTTFSRESKTPALSTYLPKPAEDSPPGENFGKLTISARNAQNCLSMFRYNNPQSKPAIRNLAHPHELSHR